jgi:catalase (peroxidase I)
MAINNPPRSPVAAAAHTALVEAARLAWTGTLTVMRSAGGITASLEGVAVVVPPAPARWSTEHSRAVALISDADTLQPAGAWGWQLRLCAGRPASGLRWEGIDDTRDAVVS